MKNVNDKIWDKWGQLVSLGDMEVGEGKADVATIIVNRNRPDLTDKLVEQVQAMCPYLQNDIYVIEMGSDRDKLSKYCSYYYFDDDFSGKCYGHNVGIRFARLKGDYRYYWVLMNDLIFQGDALGSLVSIVENQPQIGVLSPTENKSAHPDGFPRAAGDLHIVASPDYLALLIKADCVEHFGFLNPLFKYCWGAIVEYAYKLMKGGWKLAYCDSVVMTHLGGTTYGTAKNTASREHYQGKAREFAARYFVEHYGRDWDKYFAQYFPEEVIHKDIWSIARAEWESVLSDNERNLYRPVSENRNPAKVLVMSLRRKLASLKYDKEKRDIMDKIDKLHPWYYPVEIAKLRVVPGIRSIETPVLLRNRTSYIKNLLVDEVTKNYDFNGKRILDVASNCAFFSSYYAGKGATSLTAVEGRYQYVEQGKLFWQHNHFLPVDNYEFIHGDVTSSETWHRITEKCPYDFTLCAGILYHVKRPDLLIQRIMEVTTEAIVIDTRVSHYDDVIDEPGGWSFDAIIETRQKVNPNKEEVLKLLQDGGFQVKELKIAKKVPEGLLGADDFGNGSRVVLYAWRT